MFVDLMFVNSVPYLISVFKPLEYVAVTKLVKEDINTIRQDKERLRAIINTLPYRLTEQLESWLLRYVVSRINLVPTRNNPDYVSPREKLWGRRINVDKELKHGFGEYVQVHTSQVDNTMNERTSGALSLMPSGNLEGSLYYYLLINNLVDNRNKARPIPITDDIISFMNNKSIGRKI